MGVSRTRRDVLRLTAGAGIVGLAGCGSVDRSGGYESADPTTTARPVTGEYVEALHAFDETVLSFMNQERIPGGVLAVGRDGDLLLERGYGYRDADREEPMTPDTLCRIASLSKAFTRAAIHRLLEETDLSSRDRVFDHLDLDPLPEETYNDDLDAITVGHLLDHQGGWDREEAADPLFTQLDIALERGWDEPPDRTQLIRHMLSEPLQFSPGAGRAYSNFGYLVLGELVESLTAGSYQSYLETSFLEPNGIDDVRLGRSLPADRPDRETWYFDSRTCRNVVEMRPLELVRCPDGGFHHEVTGPAGGHVVTAGAFLRFMQSYWLSGRPRTDDPQTFIYNGTLPGTFSQAIQRGPVDLVLIFNQRGYNPNYAELSLRQDLLETIARIPEWPA